MATGQQQGMGWAKVLGLVGMIITTAIVALVFVRQMETGVEAKQSAEQIKTEIQEVIREQKAAIEETRRQIDLPMNR